MGIVNSNKLPQHPDEMRPFSIPFSATLSNRRVSAKVNTILPQPWIWHPIIQCAFWLCTDSLLRAQGRGPWVWGNCPSLFWSWVLLWQHPKSWFNLTLSTMVSWLAQWSLLPTAWWLLRGTDREPGSEDRQGFPFHLERCMGGPGQQPADWEDYSGPSVTG